MSRWLWSSPLCRGRSSSSQSQPSSGQPATRRMSHTRFARPDSSRSRAGPGAACSSAGRAGNRALASRRTGSSDYAGGCGSARARSLSDPAASSLSDRPTAGTASRRGACPLRPPPAPSPTPDAGQQAAAAPAPPPPSETPSTQPAAEAPLPPPAPGREASEVQGVYAPKSLEQLVGTWAYSAEDCERLFQRHGGGWAYRQPMDKFAQAAIVESTKKILLPSATCRIEGASEAEGGLKVSAECQDSISYTSRSVIIALRSATELIYSGMAVNRCRSEAGWVRKVSWNSALKPPGPSDAFGTLRQPGLRPARSRKSSRYLDGASVEPSSAERRSLASLLIWCRRSREMIRSLLKTAKRQMS